MFSLLRENKESCSSPVDGGRRDGVLQALLEVRRGQDGAPGWGRPAERKRANIWKNVAFVQAKGGVVKVA